MFGKLQSRTLACAGFIGCLAFASAAGAQPLVVRVTPNMADGIMTSGGEVQSVQTLFETGPRYETPSGVRIGLGTVIPDWIDVGSFQNMSVRGLNRAGYYGYFVSPDNKVVVIDLSNRRVMRVISQTG